MDNLLEIKFFSQNLHAFIVFFHCMLAGLGKRVVSSFETVAFGFGFSISHLKSSLHRLDLEVLGNVRNWAGRVTRMGPNIWDRFCALAHPQSSQQSAKNDARNILSFVPQYNGFASLASIGTRWAPSRVPSRTRIPGSTHTYLTGV